MNAPGAKATMTEQPPSENCPPLVEGPEPRDPLYRDRIITVPNIICITRLLGSLVMLGVAIAGHAHWFVGMFVVLTLSDWIDGRLARWLKQRSDFGAQIDSTADATLYTALLLGCLWLSWGQLQAEMGWIALGLASYILTSGYGLVKFGRIPSYHTQAAKKTQVLVLAAGIALVLEWSVWPLRLAAVAVALTNLEAIALTRVLPKWRADVTSLWSVLEDRKPDE